MLRRKNLFLGLLFLICFIFSNAINAQKINQFNANNERTGVWRKYHSNKKIRYEGKFKNGKEIGVFKFYHITTSKHPIVIKEYYKNSDSLHVKFFTTRGELQSEGMMVNRNRVGKWLYFFPDGVVLSEENYKDGKLEGESITYYHSKKIAESTFFKNGLKSGVNKKFSDDGTLIEEVNFKNGKENGLAKNFDLKGDLLEKGTYKDGKRVGNWEFYINGEIATEKEKKALRESYKKEN